MVVDYITPMSILWTSISDTLNKLIKLIIYIRYSVCVCVNVFNYQNVFYLVLLPLLYASWYVIHFSVYTHSFSLHAQSQNMSKFISHARNLRLVLLFQQNSLQKIVKVLPKFFLVIIYLILIQKKAKVLFSDN